MSDVMQTSAGPLRRVDEWQEKLHEFLVARRDQPFAWGANDCCTFVADAVQSFTGADLAADYRGRYTDEASAQAALTAVSGGATAVDALTHALADRGDLHEWRSVLFAKRGDLVSFASPARCPGLGVVDLSGTHFVFQSADGLRRWPIAKAQRAWRVG